MKREKAKEFAQFSCEMHMFFWQCWVYKYIKTIFLRMPCTKRTAFYEHHKKKLKDCQQQQQSTSNTFESVCSNQCSLNIFMFLGFYRSKRTKATNWSHCCWFFLLFLLLVRLTIISFVFKLTAYTYIPAWSFLWLSFPFACICMPFLWLSNTRHATFACLCVRCFCCNRRKTIKIFMVKLKLFVCVCACAHNKYVYRLKCAWYFACRIHDAKNNNNDHFTLVSMFIVCVMCRQPKKKWQHSDRPPIVCKLWLRYFPNFALFCHSVSV